MGELALAFLEHRRARNYSVEGVVSAEKRLHIFLAWCEERSIVRAQDVTRAVLEQYQRALFYRRKKNGRPLSALTQHGLLTVVAFFFQYLVRRHHILVNPAADLELPKLEQRLPLSVLTPEDVAAIVSLCDLSDPCGVRDRAILETLYATGVRRAELVRLGVFDLDRNRGTVTVWQGKGKKDRVIPIGERAVSWIEKYLADARPALETAASGETLFLSSYGEGLSKGYLTHEVRKYIEDARIGKRGSCHLFRHSMATAMLERGADIRYVQAMLGHAHIQSTEIYTHVAVAKLKAVYERTHPAASAARSAPVVISAGDVDEMLTALADEAADQT
jgi:integrase/recombinase XerD